LKNAQASYVLWLPSWYPNKVEPYSGDFIQRHARAVSLTEKVHVIYVLKDPSAAITSSTLTETKSEGELKETLIYYYLRPMKFKWLERLLSFRIYVRLYKAAVLKCLKEEGRPKLVHLYIAFKAGVIALWLKKHLGLAYILSEQWTIYLPGAEPNFSNLPFFNRYLIKKIMRQAAGVMVVSDYLGQRLQQLFGVSKPAVIPNVVDEKIFFYRKDNSHFANRFVHVSTLTYQKNPEAIIEAFSILKQKGCLFTLDVIGPQIPELKALVCRYGLENDIFFRGEMPQEQLVKFVQNADALILYSRYETFGCVLIEANACGVPVIVSDIPVLRENVTDGFNGIFAAAENGVALSDQIIYFIQNKTQFDKEEIAGYTIKKFNYARIGAQFEVWYKEHAADC